MLFQLNGMSRQTYCCIGKFIFTKDNPGPKDVDLSLLTLEELKQFLHNARRGVIAVEDPSGFTEFVNRLIKLQETPAAIVETVPTPVVVPEIKEVKEKTVASPKKDVPKLKQLLTKSVSSIKKTIPEMSVSEIREILDLERNGKKRKNLISIFEEQIDRHTQSVMKSVGSVDVAGKHLIPGVQMSSPMVSDIVESDTVDIEVKYT